MVSFLFGKAFYFLVQRKEKGLFLLISDIHYFKHSKLGADSGDQMANFNHNSLNWGH